MFYGALTYNIINVKVILINTHNVNVLGSNSSEHKIRVYFIIMKYTRRNSLKSLYNTVLRLVLKTHLRSIVQLFHTLGAVTEYDLSP